MLLAKEMQPSVTSCARFGTRSLQQRYGSGTKGAYMYAMDLLFLSRSQQEKGWEGGPMAPAPALVLVRRHFVILPSAIGPLILLLKLWLWRFAGRGPVYFVVPISSSPTPSHATRHHPPTHSRIERWSVIGVLGVVCSASRRWR